MLRVGRYTRSGIKLEEVRGIVVHWVGNPGTSAAANRAFFESIAESGPRFASYHELFDVSGSRLDLIPHDEVAWHAGPTGDTLEPTTRLLGGRPNWRTLGIAFCHPDATGRPEPFCEQALVSRVALLAERYDVPSQRILRHYDCTGKHCPRWYVNDLEAWRRFKYRVAALRNSFTAGMVE